MAQKTKEISEESNEMVETAKAAASDAEDAEDDEATREGAADLKVPYKRPDAPHQVPFGGARPPKEHAELDAMVAETAEDISRVMEKNLQVQKYKLEFADE